MLGLLPKDLFSLTLTEFWDMVDAKLHFNDLKMDKQYELFAWSTSLEMSATGNYGKKGVEPKKLYERRLDDLGRELKVEGQDEYKPIDKEVKENKLNELIAKFNK